MKVIKHGEVIRFVCPVCSCEFMAREEETYKKPDEQEYFAVCPDCGESDIPGVKQEFSPVVEAQAEEQTDEKKTEEEKKGEEEPAPEGDHSVIDYRKITQEQK